MRKILFLLFLLPIYSWAQDFDVRAYGAKVNGVTDDWAALTAAIRAAETVGGTVLIPTGKLYHDFRGSYGLKIGHGITIKGTCRDSSIIMTNRACPTTYGYLFMVDSTTGGAHFQDLSMIGPDSSGLVETEAVRPLGGPALTTLDNVYIEGFANGVRPFGTANVELRNVEIARCGQAVLSVGKCTILISDCYFRDTQWQGQLMQPDNFHALYVYPKANLTVTNSRFYSIPGAGVHLYSTSDSTSVGEHLVSGCVFDSCSIGILTSNKYITPNTEQIRDCRFTRCYNGIATRRTPVNISGCEFVLSSKAGQNGMGTFGIRTFHTDASGDVMVSNCRFLMTNTIVAPMGIAIWSEPGHTWTISGCSFNSSTSITKTAGIYNRYTAGTTLVSNCDFSGTYGNFAINTEGGTMNVTGCTFRLSANHGIMLNSKDDASHPISSDISGNTFSSCESAIRVNAVYPSPITITGQENNFPGASVEFLDQGGTTQRQFYLGNRHANSNSVVSATTITLSRSYNTYRVTGTTTIVNIAMAGKYYSADYGSCKIYLIMDTTASISSSGNVLPKTVAPRKPGETIYLIYDTTVKKWREVSTTRTEDLHEIPGKFVLQQNYPNPFNPSTSVAYSIPRLTHVTLQVFNAIGQEIATLVSGEMPAGTHTVIWDASDAPSGAYFCRLHTADFDATKRMLLIK